MQKCFIYRVYEVNIYNILISIYRSGHLFGDLVYNLLTSIYTATACPCWKKVSAAASANKRQQIRRRDEVSDHQSDLDIIVPTPRQQVSLMYIHLFFKIFAINIYYTINDDLKILNVIHMVQG